MPKATITAPPVAVSLRAQALTSRVIPPTMGVTVKAPLLAAVITEEY